MFNVCLKYAHVINSEVFDLLRVTWITINRTDSWDWEMHVGSNSWGEAYAYIKSATPSQLVYQLKFLQTHCSKLLANDFAHVCVVPSMPVTAVVTQRLLCHAKSAIAASLPSYFSKLDSKAKSMKVQERYQQNSYSGSLSWPALRWVKQKLSMNWGNHQSGGESINVSV